MNPWILPTSAEIGGQKFLIHADYRDILDVIRHLNDPGEPEFIRWAVALALFYEGEIPMENRQEAMEHLAEFINCGEAEKGRSGPQLLDWEHDANAIVADVNKVAGQEIRSLPFLHWWTFVACFRAIGEGQLSTLVSIRDKLRRHKKLEKWEQDYVRENREKVELPVREDHRSIAGGDWLTKVQGDNP